PKTVRRDSGRRGGKEAVSFNKLTDAEAERLALLLEELGEAQQAIGKILRHGYTSVDPTKNEPKPNNRQALERELGDGMAAVQLMDDACDLSGIAIARHKQKKLGRVTKYLHHQKEPHHD